VTTILNKLNIGGNAELQYLDVHHTAFDNTVVLK